MIKPESAPTRRSFLQGFMGLCTADLVLSSNISPAQEKIPQAPRSNAEDDPSDQMSVTLLGTGGPEFSTERRQGAATLVEANGQTLLFDAGRGVLQRLHDSGAPVNAVDKVFLTHLHSDHIVGLPELWITPWFMSGRRGTTHVYGPVGTRAMLEGMSKFLGSDVLHRASTFNPAADLGWEAAEFDGPGVVFHSGALTVTAVPVDHKEGNPAFGFIVQCGRRKLVLSGDCTLSENLIAMGQAADVVIHNVYAPSPGLLANDANKRAVSMKLATPEQAGEVFRRTHTRYGIYSHVILLDSTPEEVLQRTRNAGYRGPLLIGDDLMKIHIGADIDIVS